LSIIAPANRKKCAGKFKAMFLVVKHTIGQAATRLPSSGQILASFRRGRAG
jgi:hypothetical protein